ncbi:MAG: DNA recombination protein RmuC [Gammaproteobacteria bacterium]
MTPEGPAIIPLAIAGGFLLGFLVAQIEVRRLRQQNAELETRLAFEQEKNAERHEILEQSHQQLRESFIALSTQALRSNNEEFLKLARENLQQFQIQARADLTQKEQAIESLVKPIREALEKTEQQVRLMEKERKEAHGSLTAFLQSMTRTQQQLESETRKLVQALRRPEVRGQWGELTLRRLAELAGMVEHCDFFEQEVQGGGEGSLRPDMVIRMPDAREIVVDVKTPLDAYLSAVEAVEDGERRRQLERHARKVRERVRELAGKAYWEQFKNAPDFVVLFIPGDQFLSAALEIDPALLEDALRQKVILATPTSFIALLRAVAYGWRQLALAENAERIRETGEELYKRLATFTEHLGKVGRSLGSSIDAYNKAVGSLERSVLPGARRFTEMGISCGKKEVESLEPLDKAIRAIEGDS